MPRLYVLSGDDLGAVCDVAHGSVVGRAKEADVTVRGASISRRHARFELRGRHWYVLDLGSSNGTRVAGERIDEAPLEDGEEFLLGDVEVRFRTTDAAAGAAGAGAAPKPARSAAPPPKPAPRTPPAPPAPPAEPEGDLELELEGDWSADPVPLPASPPRPARATPPSPSPSPSGARAPQRASDVQGRRAAAVGGPVAGAKTTTSGGRILQYQRVENRGGLFGADLEQQPLLVRIALYLLVAGVFAGLAWLAYWLTSSSRV